MEQASPRESLSRAAVSRECLFGEVCRQTGNARQMIGESLPIFLWEIRV